MDSYEPARFLVGADSLSIALYVMFQFRCLFDQLLLTITLVIKSPSLVTLRREDEEQWLDAIRTPFANAKSLLKPYSDYLLDAHDVSPLVNSAKYDGPECIRPVADDDMSSTRQ